jgi:phosphohistidine phosphatase
MKLYLVQHGEAVAKDVDPERRLSEQGEQDVQSLATFLDRAGVRVERVWHSGKRRAEQTAAAMSRLLVGDRRIEAISGIKPNDDVMTFAQDADVWEQDTVVVGHQPFMGRLVAYLVSGEPGAVIVTYRPGSIACLERNADGRWEVLWMIRPELLGDDSGLATEGS